MNNKAKIAAGVVGGVLAGATIMGAAFAAPQVLSTAAFPGHSKVGSATASGTVGIPTYAEMQAFMQRYRTGSGGVDVDRMHADVTSGRVTPPCLEGGTASPQAPAPSTQAQPRVGYGMMGGTY